MSNKEYRSPEELAMQKALDGIREEFPDFWKDLEEFDEEPEISEPETSKPETADPAIEATRRRKFRRRLIAACFIGVCILSTAMTIFINSDAAHAMKFAMEKKYYQAKGWVQATDPGYTENDEITILIDDEEKISVGKMIWNELKIPNYMSQNYAFKELLIEKTISGTVSAIYQYEKEEDSIVILIRKVTSNINTQLYVGTTDVLNGNYEYKLWADDSIGIKGIDVVVDDTFVSVAGPLKESELKKIVNGLYE